VVAEGGVPMREVAFANYVAMAGTFEVSVYPDTGNGVFYRNSRTRLTDITDGTSNTIFVIERWSKKSPMTTWVGGVTGSGNPPLIAGYDEELPGTLVLTNTGQALDGRVPNNPLGHVEDASSPFAGGTCALMGDCSVRLLLSSMSPVAWEALGTRAGGETFADDF